MHNHCCREEAVIITYYKCVSVALVINHAKRMRRFILSTASCPVLPYFSTYLIKGTIFEKKNRFEYEMCFLAQQLLSGKSFILRGIQRDIIVNVHVHSSNRQAGRRKDRHEEANGRFFKIMRTRLISVHYFK